ncbi:MAG TPA: KpsF/GutQ family sugar-phosphate isomerase [Rhabdochlamydiaceae bacterium]|jgi:arabinose-5-phosphate isomerase
MQQLLSELLEKQHEQIEYYFQHFDKGEMEKLVDACLRTEGLIIFTGVGKSGIIAEKIAMTLVSTGTKALYLPPTNFLHGDIGILSEKDLLVFLSRSGETEELFHLIPFARKRNARLAALVSNRASRLAKICDISVCVPVEKELCPFDLAPTTSTAAQLLCGDLLAVALMRAKEFNLAAYVLNHPSGTIGKKMTLKVEDLMSKEMPLAKPEEYLIDVLNEFSNKRRGALLITDEKCQLLGIFTDGDLRRSLQIHGSTVLNKPLKELMSPMPITIAKDALAWDALKLMQKDPKKFVMILPVVENGIAVGILRMHDIVQAGLG